MPQTRRRISLTINGESIRLEADPASRVVDILRDNLGLTGTKIGCEIGVCGACTVLLDGAPVSACLTLAFQVDGRVLRTIEGVASGASLHPVQAAFLETGGLQCGFCTPGQIMAAVGFLEQHANPTDDQIEEAMLGNLCRCTGYYPIAAAIRLAARSMPPFEDKRPGTAPDER
jgi:carbon-monoxide dehydrogenase small subunit